MSSNSDGQAGASTPSTTANLSAWAAFAYRDFTMLWMSNVTAMVTMQMRTLVSIQWLYEETGSAAQIGLLGLVQLIQMPMVLYGGALADNADRKRLMTLTQVFAFAMLIGLTLLAATDGLAPWHIFAVTGLSGIVNMLGNPARSAMVSRVVPRSHISHAVSTNTATFQIAGIAAPLLFALMYEVFGVTAAFAVATAAAGVSMFTPLLIRVSGKPDGGSRKTDLNSIKEGWRFVMTHRILPGLYLMDIGVTIVSFYRMLFPVFADQLYGLGAAGVGALNAANSIGGVAGTFVVIRTASWKRKGRIVLFATLAYSFLLLAFGLNREFWLGLVIVGLLGSTDAVGMVMRQTVVQLTTPDKLLGRASSAHSFSAMGANNIGQMEVGFMSGVIGAGNTMVLGGVVSILVVMAIWQFMPGLRTYEYTESDPNAPPDTS
ncbi:MAG: MFS transporter [Chloroflexi bacterium]|nr:MFS transporter [Chloroflexota bacterium]